MDCSTPGLPVHPNSWSLLKLMSIESVMPSIHLILCCPLFPPSVFPSIRVFSSESLLRIRWPKYWNFSFNISPSSEYSGLISFRIEWFDLLVVQGTLKSLLQHHSSKASILWHSAFFMVQLSHPYMAISMDLWKTRRQVPGFCGRARMLLLARYQNQVWGGRVYFWNLHKQSSQAHIPSGVSASLGHLPELPMQPLPTKRVLLQGPSRCLFHTLPRKKVNIFQWNSVIN